MTEEVFLAPLEAEMHVQPIARLTVHEQLVEDTRIIPFRSVGYDLGDYHVEHGFPVADTALGVGIPTEATVYGMSASETPGEIFVDGPENVVSRWLPVEGSLEDPTQWTASVGSRRFSLFNDGTTTELDTAYDYVRNHYQVPGAAMRLAEGDYFYTDDVDWSADSMAFVLVAVMHTPDDNTCGLLETYPFPDADPNRSYVGLRYSANGAVTTHSLGKQNDRQTTSQGSRTGQPIVVGMRIAGLEARTVVKDRSETEFDFTLTAPHPSDGRMWVGRSMVMTGVAPATMDILEVDYFEDISLAELKVVLARLDHLYGVSSG